MDCISTACIIDDVIQLVLVSWYLIFKAYSAFRITFWSSVMAISTVIDTISPDFYISNGLCPKIYLFGGEGGVVAAAPCSIQGTAK